MQLLSAHQAETEVSLLKKALSGRENNTIVKKVLLELLKIRIVKKAFSGRQKILV